MTSPEETTSETANLPPAPDTATAPETDAPNGPAGAVGPKESSSSGAADSRPAPPSGGIDSSFATPEQAAGSSHTSPVRAADPDPVSPSGATDSSGAAPSKATGSRRASTYTRHLIAWVIAALSASAYILYSLLQWETFTTPSWDLGIFTELAKQYSQFDAPTVDIKGPGFNLLGDHFHPLLILLGPIYKIFPSGLTLLVLQDVLFALSSVPITLLAIKRLGYGIGTVIGIGYVASWGLWSAVESQFHEIAFGVPLLAYGLARWVDTKGHSRSAVISMSLLVFVKEDLGLTVSASGLVMVWQTWGAASRTHNRFALRSRKSFKETFRSHHGRIGAYLAAWGVAWTLIAIFVLLPLFNPQGGWEYTNRLAENEAVASNFLVRLFLPMTKYVTLLLLALAAGFIGLLSPYAWIMLPTLAWRFAGNVEYYWGWHWHYSAILVPIAAIALIDTCSRWRGSQAVRLGTSVVALASNALVAWFGPLGQLFDGRTPFSVNEEQAQAGRQAVKALGSGHDVVANLPMLAYTVPGNRVYWEGTYGRAKIDAVILAPSNTTGGLSADVWAAEKFGGSWKLVYSHLNYQVAIRK